MLYVSRLVQNEREIIIIIACFSFFLFNRLSLLLFSLTRHIRKRKLNIIAFSFWISFCKLRIFLFFIYSRLIVVLVPFFSEIFYPWSIVSHVRVVVEVYVHLNFIPRKNDHYQENVLHNNFTCKNKYRTVISRKVSRLECLKMM